MSKPDFGQRIFPARTPGPTGLNDQADPNVFSELGKTPGPTGYHDYAELISQAPPLRFPEQTQAPFSGAVPVGVGAGAKVRIPMPGSGGLHIEFTARGWTPPEGSSFALFIQDLTGKRHLRLDFGRRKVPGTKDKYIIDFTGIEEEEPTKYSRSTTTHPQDVLVKSCMRGPNIFVTPAEPWGLSA